MYNNLPQFWIVRAIFAMTFDILHPSSLETMLEYSVRDRVILAFQGYPLFMGLPWTSEYDDIANGYARMNHQSLEDILLNRICEPCIPGYY